MIETLVVAGALIVIAVVAVYLLRRWAERPEAWESRLDDVLKKEDKDDKKDGRK